MLQVVASVASGACLAYKISFAISFLWSQEAACRFKLGVPGTLTQNGFGAKQWQFSETSENNGNLLVHFSLNRVEKYGLGNVTTNNALIGLADLMESMHVELLFFLLVFTMEVP